MINDQIELQLALGNKKLTAEHPNLKAFMMQDCTMLKTKPNLALGSAMKEAGLSCPIKCQMPVNLK